MLVRDGESPSTRWAVRADSLIAVVLLAARPLFPTLHRQEHHQDWDRHQGQSPQSPFLSDIELPYPAYEDVGNCPRLVEPKNVDVDV